MFDMEKTRDQLLAYFVVTFFDWARSQGLKKRDSIPMCIESLYLCTQSFVSFVILQATSCLFCMKQSLFDKIFITYQKIYISWDLYQLIEL